VESFRSFLRIPVEEPVTSVLFGGLLGAMFSFLQYINAPLLGALSDKYGNGFLFTVNTVISLKWSGIEKINFRF
jgi:hypothetical protein